MQMQPNKSVKVARKTRGRDFRFAPALTSTVSQTMKQAILTTLFFFALSSLSYASYDKNDEHEGWKTKDGKLVPNTDSMKSIKGFGGWLIITADHDWEEKWNTPSYISPRFNEAKTVKYGQKLAILTFFINPKLSDDGTVNISCGIKVIRPDKTVSVNQQDIECIKDAKIINPRNVHLSPVYINYIGEEGDPPGEWTIEMNINDLNRGAFIPLKSSFTLQ